MISEVIYTKLSFDNILNLSFELEALKKKTLSDEDYENFEYIARYNLTDLLKEFKIE